MTNIWIYQSFKIKTSTVFNLVFVNNTILSSFFFFFLIIDLYFLITIVITKIFIVIAELVIPTEIPTKEARAEIEIHPVIVEASINAQYNLKSYKPFCAFYLLIQFALFLQ